MKNKFTVIQWIAWFYCANFLAIVILSHWPGLTDAEGRLLGFFAIDPIDDIFHLISGLAAGVCAWRSHRWSVNYFKWAGLPYLIDAITGLCFGVESLNGDIFTEGIRGPNFTLHGLVVNLPHVVIPVTMMLIGFWLSKRVRRPE